MTIGKSLTSILFTGILVLGLAGCENKNPDKKDIEQETKLYTGYFGGVPPINSNLEEGFIDPQKVIVEIRDQNHNGKREIILNYEGERYLMKKDDSGRAYLQAYQVKPAEIKPAEIIPQ